MPLSRARFMPVAQLKHHLWAAQWILFPKLPAGARFGRIARKSDCAGREPEPAGGRNLFRRPLPRHPDAHKLQLGARRRTGHRARAHQRRSCADRIRPQRPPGRADEPAERHQPDPLHRPDLRPRDQPHLLRRALLPSLLRPLPHPRLVRSPRTRPLRLLENPQSLNLYSYVLNNPVTSLDRDGHVRTDDASNLAAWAPMDEGMTMESLFGDEFGFDALASIDAQHAERDALLAAIAGIPMSVRENVGDSVADSNSPDADDKSGGFHEEGGLWGANDAGATVVQRAVPGKYANPDKTDRAEINLWNFKDPDHAQITSVTGSWHVHPRGVGETGRYFVQGPSGTDEHNRIGTITFVVGASSGRVYFYDGSRVLHATSLKS